MSEYKTEEEMTDEALAASNEGRNELAERIRIYLMRKFYKNFVNRADLEDFVQGFFEKKFQAAISNFDPARCQFKTLIHKYASNYFIDCVRSGNGKRRNELGTVDLPAIPYYEDGFEYFASEEILRYFVNKANEVLSFCKYIFSWYAVFDNGDALFAILKNDSTAINLDSAWLINHKFSSYMDLCEITDAASLVFEFLDKETVGPYMPIVIERLNRNHVKGTSLICDGLSETPGTAEGQIAQWARDAKKQFKERAKGFRKEYTEGC